MKSLRKVLRRSLIYGLLSSQSRKQDVAHLRDAYFKTADAWSAIEFLHFGPAGVDFRFERMSYWPERKNATGKALTILLAGQGDEVSSRNISRNQRGGTGIAGTGTATVR